MADGARNGRWLTTPNLLSLARLPLGLLFWIAMAAAPERALPPLAVLAAAALTDVFDGIAARRAGVDLAGVGSWLDPLCDKLFVGTVLAALYVQRGVPLGLLALIVARELLQLPMSLVYRAVPTLRRWLRYDFRASPLGKAATISQFLAITALVAGLRARVPIVLAFTLGIVALGDYVLRAIEIGRHRPARRQDTAA
ncbi:MAG TPA: CDP-alcohol phosphatidyltransferase family protein [Polyangia bacterium]|nr:CDP-alcohol phosphatidyltransferase family protein [Polyangia bacterium]